MASENERLDVPILTFCPFDDIYQIFIMSLHVRVLIFSTTLTNRIGCIKIDYGISMIKKRICCDLNMLFFFVSAMTMLHKSQIFRILWDQQVSDDIKIFSIFDGEFHCK